MTQFLSYEAFPAESGFFYFLANAKQVVESNCFQRPPHAGLHRSSKYQILFCGTEEQEGILFKSYESTMLNSFFQLKHLSFRVLRKNS